MVGHIDRAALRANAYGEDELSHEESTHLRGCSECSDRLDWYVGLRESAAALPRIRPPGWQGRPEIAGMAASAASRRRAAGPGLRRYALRVAAFAAVLLPVVIVLLPGNRLSAHSSELRFANVPLRAGDSATVVYSPSVTLAREDSVVVRARFREAEDPRVIALEHVRAGVLRRGDDGDFHGRIEVPRGAVYGVMAVESATADQVDTNFGRLFDVMVDDGARGRWSRQQQVNDLLRRNWEKAVVRQRELAEKFPNDPLAWKDLLALEQ